MGRFIYFDPGEQVDLADLDLTFTVQGDNISLIENPQIQDRSLDWFHFLPPIGFSNDTDIQWTSSGALGSWADLTAYKIHRPRLDIAAEFDTVNTDTVVLPGVGALGWVDAGVTISGNNIDLSPLGNARFNAFFFSANAMFDNATAATLADTFIAVQLRDSAGNWHTLPSSVRRQHVEIASQFAYSTTSTNLAVEGLVTWQDAPLADSIVSGIRVVVAKNGTLGADSVELDRASLVVLFLE